MTISSCTNNSKKEINEEMKTETVKDPHSFARTEEAVVKHLALDITVDFSKKTIGGKATNLALGFGRTVIKLLIKYL